MLCELYLHEAVIKANKGTAGGPWEGDRLAALRPGSREQMHCPAAAFRGPRPGCHPPGPYSGVQPQPRPDSTVSSATLRDKRSSFVNFSPALSPSPNVSSLLLVNHSPGWTRPRIAPPCPL